MYCQLLFFWQAVHVRSDYSGHRTDSFTFSKFPRRGTHSSIRLKNLTLFVLCRAHQPKTSLRKYQRFFFRGDCKHCFPPGFFLRIFPFFAMLRIISINSIKSNLIFLRISSKPGSHASTEFAIFLGESGVEVVGGYPVPATTEELSFEGLRAEGAMEVGFIGFGPTKGEFFM